MPVQNKTCPQCNNTMQIRLGMYDCESCGYTEEIPVEAPQEDSAEQQESSGWDKRKYGGMAAAPKAPEPNTLVTAGPIKRIDEFKHKHDDPLVREKSVYLAICVVGFLFHVILYSLDRRYSGFYSPEFQTAQLIGYAVGLLLTYFILFTRMACIKWFFIVLGGLYVLLFAIIGFAGGTILPQFFYIPGTGYFNSIGFAVSAFVWWFMIIICISWYVWFVSIMWRDMEWIQELRRQKRAQQRR